MKQGSSGHLSYGKTESAKPHSTLRGRNRSVGHFSHLEQLDQHTRSVSDGGVVLNHDVSVCLHSRNAPLCSNSRKRSSNDTSLQTDTQGTIGSPETDADLIDYEVNLDDEYIDTILYPIRKVENPISIISNFAVKVDQFLVYKKNKEFLGADELLFLIIREWREETGAKVSDLLGVLGQYKELGECVHWLKEAVRQSKQIETSNRKRPKSRDSQMMGASASDVSLASDSGEDELNRILEKMIPESHRQGKSNSSHLDIVIFCIFRSAYKPGS